MTERVSNAQRDAEADSEQCGVDDQLCGTGRVVVDVAQPQT